MKNINDIRQGDTYLYLVDKLPIGAKKIAKNPILKHGESGNTHRLVGDQWDLYEYEGTKYLQVYQPTSYIHEEHKEKIIVPGVYDITNHQERSYDPFKEETVTTID